jgi:hypothetical protein
MRKIADFSVGEHVLYHTRKYCCKTRSYTPLIRPAVVTKLGEHGVTIEVERGQNPDYNIHVGSMCLDALEKQEGLTSALMFRPKASD